jgi:hypothetical protein
MAATNGLAKRLDDLEAAVIGHQDRHTHGREMLADRFSAMAARRQGQPASDGKSPADRVVREALAESDGAHDPAFWRAVSRGLRAYLRGRAA